MKIGFYAIGLNNLARPDLITTVATNAERLDFAAIYATEHVVFIEKCASQYPYFPENPVRLTSPFLNPFIALTYAAAHTQRIRLATGICIVPEYNPLLLTKLTASLDYLSNGRFALGIGIGWQKEEFEALSIPWERRAQRTAEYVEAMRGLWGDQKSFAGEFVNFEGVLSYPKPLKGAKFPILGGGNSEPALRRAASFCNGWCGFNLSPPETAASVVRLRALLKENGRDPDDFEYIVAATPQSTPADLPAYRAAGIDELDVCPVLHHPFATDAEIVSVLEKMAHDWVVPAARL